MSGLAKYSIDTQTFEVFDELVCRIREEEQAGNLGVETRVALTRFLDVLPLFKAVSTPGRRKGAILKQLRQQNETPIGLEEEEECEHSETECGHCIDCGQYFNRFAEAYNFSD
jgi:hypothetical protein